MGKIVFLNRFFFPDETATSQMLSDLAFALARDGLSVHVVAGRGRLDDPDSLLPRREMIHGVQVRRFGGKLPARSRLLTRLLGDLSFYILSAITLLRMVTRDDILVTKTDPPLSPVIGTLVAGIKRAKHAAWIQDLYPEVAAALGAISPDGRLFRWSRAARNRALRHCSKVVVIGQRMASRLQSEGISGRQIEIIPNWADGQAIRPLETPDNPLRYEWGLERDFVVGYSGNLGRAHDLDTLIDAAKLLDRAPVPSSPDMAPPIRFLFIGEGYQKPRLQALASTECLRNLSFRPFQPRTLLMQSLGVPDVHVVSLRPELEGLIVPSKIYGVMAAGRPLLFIGDPEGETAQMINDHGIGMTIAPGDAARLAAAIGDYATNPDLRIMHAQQARQLFTSNFDMTTATAHWRELLRSLAG